MENNKDFMNDIAIQLNIKKPSDWGNVSCILFSKLGGSGLLHQYNNSLFSCLKAVYAGK